MKLTPALKEIIDSLSYEDMLRRWRFAPVGDLMFQDESGEYFAQRMRDARTAVDTVAASKKVGWEP